MRRGPNPGIRKLLSRVPGKERLGAYRFIPLFFLMGAGLEYTMIHWSVGETNFYKTFKKREVEKALTYEEKLRARLEEFSK